MFPGKATTRSEPGQQASSEIPDSITPRFVASDSTTAVRYPTGQHPCQGLYWCMKDHAPSVVFMLSHYIADFSEHYLAVPLALRGYGVLGWNTRFTGAEDRFVLEQAMDDLAVGTSWIRNNTPAKKIVFIGNSGGGSLMAAFQAKAERESLSAMGADAFIFLNAHPGRADVMARWIDPSVVDESDPVKTDPSLDMYAPQNGPPYSAEFIQRYRGAQVARSEKITEWAKKELRRLNDAGVPDRVFPVYRTMADLRFMDPNIEPSDRPCPACYAGDPVQANRGISMIARASTLKTWLSMWSLADSQAQFELSGPHFTVPTLIIQATADVGVYPSDAHKIYDLVASKDKELKLIPGAAHFFEDSPKSLVTAVGYIDDWVKEKMVSS
ncbi:uncharacterized protein Z518_04613 [Rhinocladiella mackenziei CBS 650.93]|uniref:Serine aminopeptidase S33 domain-containing protein n=1 Tax=Rhinocladiella mackenziei CBS 650.93 TaxID=1442369 RepID=A0A0D2FWM6_9EURO|nr:uncharacterized protein Z518_04613 [Rhinocladiella mackenziei CBS 650.93]KIX06637.1 hypothetical protein Z518_04613 [Rhinocladiella mackenziei CBS 650.93]